MSGHRLGFQGRSRGSNHLNDARGLRPLWFGPRRDPYRLAEPFRLALPRGRDQKHDHAVSHGADDDEPDERVPEDGSQGEDEESKVASLQAIRERVGERATKP